MNELVFRSHPSCVCGLKRFLLISQTNGKASHPSWVCGLKLAEVARVNINFLSHPSWVCGLKQFIIFIDVDGVFVTPFVGVWIETGI